MTNLPQIDDLKRQLAQLEELASQGVLSPEAAAEARAKVERAIVDAVMSGAVDTPKAAPDLGSSTTAPAAASAQASTMSTPDEAGAAAPRRLPRRLVAAVAVFVIVVGAAGYLWRGNYEGWKVGPGDEVAAAASDAQGGHGASNEQIEGMVSRLTERLKENPDDADGWAMLGRTYTALGRNPEALDALRKVVALKPKDAQALADLADAIAVTNNRSLEGEPEKLIAQAVSLDPKNVKALALAGTVAFGREDFKGAAAYWQKAVDASDPNADFTRQLHTALNEARQRAGLPTFALTPGLPASAAAAPSKAAEGAAAAGARITGRVSVADSLKDRVAPGDTVFIFARPVSGSKMPLAILRRQASELPLEFTLDDSMAMSPAAKLSSSPQVIVGARISKSGNAMPQAGDLQGLSSAVRVGSSGLRIEIAEAVR
jgi:cytochrome c-type biogenesis protein CcmH